MAEARLAVTVDVAPALDLARRIAAAVTDAITAARAANADDQALAAVVSGAVLSETLRIAPTSATRAEAERDEARAALAALHEGEEPDSDPLAEPTPAQWLWRWNRATPEQRLEVAAVFMANAARAEHCMFMRHEARLAEHDAKRGL